MIARFFNYLDRHPGAALAIVAACILFVGIIEAHSWPFA